jgi:hypothetical protein
VKHRNIIVKVVAERRELLLDAQPAQHVVPSHAKQESTYRPARRIEHMTLAHQEEKNFLRDVLSDRFRPAHLQGKPVDRPLTPAIQHGERFLVSGKHQPQQFEIVKVVFKLHRRSVNGIRYGHQESSSFWKSCLIL